MKIRKLVSVADNVLDLVLGEQINSTVEHSVKQYPSLIYYYPKLV